MKKVSIIPQATINETILSWEVVKPESRITVAINPVIDVERVEVIDDVETTVTVAEIDRSNPTTYTTITGEYYDALMSDKPIWNKKKPEGMFLEEDLWVVIDAIRSGTSLGLGTKMKEYKL